MAEHKHSFNAAARVHAILDRARRQNQGRSVKETWATVFEIDPTDPAPLLERYVALIREVDQLIGLFERLPGVRNELYLRALGAVRLALNNVNFDTSWGNVASLLTDSVIVGLEFCADTLDKVDHEREIPQPDLESLRVAVEELTSSLLNAEVDADFKRELVSALNRIRSAILLYHIGGAAALREAMDLLVGTLIRQPENVRKESKPFVDRAVAVVEKINTVTSLALHLKELGGPIMGVLLTPGPG
jgi:hypothetical protein